MWRSGIVAFAWIAHESIVAAVGRRGRTFTVSPSRASRNVGGEPRARARPPRAREQTVRETKDDGRRTEQSDGDENVFTPPCAHLSRHRRRPHVRVRVVGRRRDGRSFTPSRRNASKLDAERNILSVVPGLYYNGHGQGPYSILYWSQTVLKMVRYYLKWSAQTARNCVIVNAKKRRVVSSHR